MWPSAPSRLYGDLDKQSEERREVSKVGRRAASPFSLLLGDDITIAQCGETTLESQSSPEASWYLGTLLIMIRQMSRRQKLSRGDWVALGVVMLRAEFVENFSDVQKGWWVQ